MPTYDYRCRKCGHVFEVFHSMKDDKPRRCPKCRARAERVPGTGAGLLFRGSGFYTTDYRSSSYREKAKQDKTEKPAAKESGGATDSGGKGASRPKGAKGRSPGRGSGDA